MGKSDYEARDNWNPSLTRQQKESQPAIEWYLDATDDTRRTGRTYLIAVVFIRQALLRPESKVLLYDHWPYPLPYGTGHLPDLVRELIRTDEYLKKFKWEVNMEVNRRVGNVMDRTGTLICLGLREEE